MISPQHFTELTNGYEKQSSGLWTHKGTLSASGVRATGPLIQNPSSLGPGVQLQYDQPSGIGYVQAYDYSTPAWKDLQIAARNINIVPNGGGTLTLPANSVGTNQIQGGAAQQQVGISQVAGGWSSAVTSTWLGTAVSFNGTTSGGLLRFEWTLTFYHSAPNAAAVIGPGWNGAAQLSAGAIYFPAAALNPVTISGVWYTTLPANLYTFQMFATNQTAGTLTLSPSQYSILAVTEQKR